MKENVDTTLPDCMLYVSVVSAERSDSNISNRLRKFLAFWQTYLSQRTKKEGSLLLSTFAPLSVTKTFL